MMEVSQDDVANAADFLFEALSKPTNSDEDYVEALDQVKTFVESKTNDDEAQLIITNARRFVPVVAQFFAHRNLQIAELARAILEKAYGIIPNGFFSEATADALRALIDGTTSKRLSDGASKAPNVASLEMIRIRVYDFLFRIATQSSDTLPELDRTKLLGPFFDELNATISDAAHCDLLAALNYVQLLGDFAATPHGIAYLDASPREVISKLNAVLLLTLTESERQTDPMLSFFWPALLKFFASIARANCNWLFDRRTFFWQSLKVAITENVDLTIRLIAIETLGWIFEPVANKLIADNRWRDDFAICARSLYRALVERTIDVDREARVRIAETFTRLLDAEVHIDGQSANPQETSHILTQWLTLLGGTEFINALFNTIKRQSPADPLRIALFGTLSTISRAPNGIGLQLVRDCAGLVEYLIDRSTESGSNADAKRVKFDAVAALVRDREAAMRTFDAPLVARLMRFVADGPFYAQAESRVDLEAPN